MKENSEKWDGSREALSPEELEKVSGGSCSELSDDSSVLSELGLCSRYGYFKLIRSPGHRQEIIDAWQKAGVECRFDDGSGNEYYIDGKKVLRSEAIDFVNNRK